MRTRGAREAVQAWVDAVNAQDLDAYAAAITEDYTWRLWDATTTGRTVSIEAWKELWRAFPDLRIELLDIVADGSRAATRARMSGTHRGPLRFRGTSSWDQPFPPSGKRFELAAGHWHEVRDGRVCVTFAYWLPAQMLQQLGLVPVPPPMSPS